MARRVSSRMVVFCSLSVTTLLIILVQQYKLLVSPILQSSVYSDQKSSVSAAMATAQDVTASTSGPEKEHGDPSKIAASAARKREQIQNRFNWQARRSVLLEATLRRGRTNQAAILKPNVSLVPGAERSDIYPLTRLGDSRDSDWFWRLFLPPPPPPPPRAHENSFAHMHQGQARKKILLLTYVRSGSSLTGDIIDHSSEVYYVFEPLFGLQQFAKSVEGGIKRFIAENTQFVTAARVILHRLLSCDLADLAGTLHKPFLARINDTSGLEKCYKLPPTDRSACLEEAESVCRSHDAILLKVIRYPVTDLRPLIALHPELKVIYLVRDPRANFWSRINVLKKPARNNFIDFAQDVCARMRDDVISAFDLLNTSSDHIRFLRYEDLAADPLRVSERIYKFLRLHWTDRIKDMVLKQTNFSVDEAGTRQNRLGHWRIRTKRDHLLPLPYTVVRPDSSDAARAWRKTIPWDVVQGIQEACQPVMNLLGFTPLRSLDEVRNQSVPCVGELKILRGLNTLNANLGNS